MVIERQLTKREFSQKMQDSREKFYRMAFCYVKNEHDALEIISEATYKGFTNYKKLKNPSFFNTWMTRIIINTAIDYLRQQNRYTAYEDSIIQFNNVETTSTISLEQKLDLYRALDMLSTQEKAYIILKFFEEKTFREIAEILSEPEGTVKTRIYKILSRLNHLLREEDKYE